MNSQNQKQAFQRKFQKLPKASVASMPNTFTSVIAKATTPTSIFSGHFLSTFLLSQTRLIFPLNTNKHPYFVKLDLKSTNICLIYQLEILTMSLKS